MALVNYADSALSILPPVAAILLAIFTRNVLLSLGTGILLGLALLTDFNLAPLGSEITARAVGLVWSDGGFAKWNLFTIGFLMSMGILMALVSVSGGSRAFAIWISKRIKTERGAQFTTLILGCLVFIDDYFNALLVGNVSRPITDQYRISREKLAYCIDSTSAPICVLSPISTWGAYIMSLLAGLIAIHGLTDYTPLSLFVAMIPHNFYALTALGMLILVIWFGINVGPMAQAQARVASTGQLWDQQKGMPAGEDLGLEQASNGRVINLVLPILTLVGLVVGLMLHTGHQALITNGLDFSLIAALENSNGAWSMVTAGFVTVALTLVAMVLQGTNVSLLVKAIVMGMRSMLPAVYILLMAWTIAAVIGDLKTGQYLANLLSGNLPLWLVPALVLCLSAAAAFSTGTSYGTFAIMLPITANLAMAMDPAILVTSLGAVLAGGVFGDHCSPISDTTILSSTGSGCHHIDHVTTQLPYALIAGGISLTGYVAQSVSGSLVLGLVVCALGLLLFGMYGNKQAQMLAIRSTPNS